MTLDEPVLGHILKYPSFQCSSSCSPPVTTKETLCPSLFISFDLNSTAPLSQAVNIRYQLLQ